MRWPRRPRLPTFLDADDWLKVVGILALSLLVLWAAVIVGLAGGLVVRMFMVASGLR